MSSKWILSSERTDHKHDAVSNDYLTEIACSTFQESHSYLSRSYLINIDFSSKNIVTNLSEVIWLWEEWKNNVKNQREYLQGIYLKILYSIFRKVEKSNVVKCLTTFTRAMVKCHKFPQEYFKYQCHGLENLLSCL